MILDLNLGVLEVIRTGKAAEWSEHLNNMNSTSSIKLIHKEETDNSIPLLDTHIHRMGQ